MDGESAESKSFLRRRWEEWKGYLGDRFYFVDAYSRLLIRESPLPWWSASDVEDFMASDPVYGPTLRTKREALKYAATGSVIGAVSTAAVSWKYSKSPHGALLSFGAGALLGLTFGQEVANHWLQLYRVDTMAAQVKFLEWWEKKAGERS